MSSPAILEICIQDTVRLFIPAIRKCVAAVASELQNAESKSQKNVDRLLIASAWRELLQNAQILNLQYIDDLTEALKISANMALETIAHPHYASQDVGKSTTSALSAFLPKSGLSSYTDLSLIEDADVAHAISSTRFLHQLSPYLEGNLEELNRLISAVQGLPRVRPDLNPLRPEIFVQTLVNLMATVASEPAVSLQWFMYFAKPLGREINSVYAKLIVRLQDASVQAVAYSVLPSSAGTFGSGASGLGAQSAGLSAGTPKPLRNLSLPQGQWTDYAGAPAQSAYRSMSQYGNFDGVENNDALLQDFLYQGGTLGASYALPASYYATQEEALAELMATASSQPSVAQYVDDSANLAYTQLPAVDRPSRAVNAQTQLNQAVWGEYGLANNRAIVRAELKTQAKDVGQVLSLEMVRKLVNKVAQNARLLTPVREAIVALEPSLLRLAMVDPSFFIEEAHAGRRLLERVAQRSFQFNDEFGADFKQFLGSVQGSFKRLNALQIHSALPFKDALVALDMDWGQQDRLATEHKDRALAALRFTQERQALADTIAYGISTRPDLDAAAGVVLDFLFGPWALVIAHAQLTDTHKQLDPQGFKVVVSDLIWSSKSKLILKHPAKLIGMVPSLLGKLQAGLKMLGTDPQDNAAFFDALMRLHQPALNLRRQKSQRDLQTTDAAPLELPEPAATPEQRLAKVAAQPWLGKDDVAAFGFEDTFANTQGDTLAFDEKEDGGVPGHASQDAVASPAVTQAEAALDTAAAEQVAQPVSVEQVLHSLRINVWVDLYSQRKWTRAQLVWVNDKNTLFMFASHGGQPHSMTRRRCERLISDNLLRTLQTHGVVAQALDAVADQLAPA